MTLPEILQEAKQLDLAARSIKKEVFQLCWHMRGLGVEEGIMLSHEDRQIMAEMVREHMEITKKSGMPYF